MALQQHNALNNTKRARVQVCAQLFSPNPVIAGRLVTPYTMYFYENAHRQAFFLLKVEKNCSRSQAEHQRTDSAGGCIHYHGYAPG